MDFKPSYLTQLNRVEGINAAFVSRIHDITVSIDRDATVQALEPAHKDAANALGYNWKDVWRAEQIHSNHVAEITEEHLETPAYSIPAVDGLMTKARGIALGIYVADCGAVLISDKRQKYIAALHSGKKGTELNITGKTIAKMKSTWNSRPEDLIVALAPCIRPPHYEIDFAATIKEQIIAEGISLENYHDCGICTAANVDAFYSYRLEKGNTGRMLALIGT